MIGFNPIRKKLVIKTAAEGFFAVLRSEMVAVYRYLIQLQNVAVDVGWAPRQVIPRRPFPNPGHGNEEIRICLRLKR